MSKAAKYLFAFNAILAASLASPDVLALIQGHPKGAVAFAILSNLSHLIAEFKQKFQP